MPLSEGEQSDNWHRMGYCPQCQAQIMVKDTKGHWTTYKSNFRFGDLIFSNDHILRTTICEGCLKNPDFTVLIDSILHEKSEALKHRSPNIAAMSRAYIERVYEECGPPIRIETYSPNFLKSTMSARSSKNKFQTMENANEIFQNRGGSVGN